ncbi:MAG TPA: hypothetical protein VGP13_00415 [Candidatus Paceibacterota bacterium]|jgi:hypothetical protein|nr:hypothetical protein [Candidatus Paceibacterota bacterium]
MSDAIRVHVIARGDHDTIHNLLTTEGPTIEHVVGREVGFGERKVEMFYYGLVAKTAGSTQSDLPELTLRIDNSGVSGNVAEERANMVGAKILERIPEARLICFEVLLSDERRGTYWVHRYFSVK